MLATCIDVCVSLSPSPQGPRQKNVQGTRFEKGKQTALLAPEMTLGCLIRLLSQKVLGLRQWRLGLSPSLRLRFIL